MKKIIILLLLVSVTVIAGPRYFVFSGLKIARGETFKFSSDDIELSIYYPKREAGLAGYFAELKIVNNTGYDLNISRDDILFTINGTNQSCGIYDHENGSRYNKENGLLNAMRGYGSFPFGLIKKNDTLSGYFLLESRILNRKIIKKSYKAGNDVSNGTIELVFRKNGSDKAFAGDNTIKIIVPIAIMYDQKDIVYQAGRQLDKFGL